MRLADVVTGPWAITPEMLIEISGIYAIHLRGEKIDVAKVEAALGRPLANSQQDTQVIDGVAVIEIQGAMAKKMNLFSRISGGVSTQIVASEIESALKDPTVKGIILNIDSPGGTVDGTGELADIIYQSRGKKPIVAFSDGMICSAAYWTASSCDSIYISGNTNPVGSIGVVSAHRDYSKYEEKQGIKTTEITAGAYKRVASPYEPLNEAGRADIQGKLDHIYTEFVDTVARNRGTTPEKVLSDMADGRVFLGSQAINAGLVDGVSTLALLIQAMQTPQKRADIMKRKKIMVAGALPKEKSKMTITEIKEQYPEVVAEIVSEATAGLVDQATCDAAAKAASDATAERLTELVAATVGEESGEKFKALVASGITAAAAGTLGISIAPETAKVDSESRKQILDAIQKSAPEGLQNAKAEEEEKASAIAAIVSGATR